MAMQAKPSSEKLGCSKGSRHEGSSLHLISTVIDGDQWSPLWILAPFMGPVDKLTHMYRFLYRRARRLCQSYMSTSIPVSTIVSTPSAYLVSVE